MEQFLNVFFIVEFFHWAFSLTVVTKAALKLVHKLLLVDNSNPNFKISDF